MAFFCCFIALQIGINIDCNTLFAPVLIELFAFAVLVRNPMVLEISYLIFEVYGINDSDEEHSITYHV